MTRLGRGTALILALGAGLAACNGEVPPMPPASLVTAIASDSVPSVSVVHHPRATTHPLVTARVAELVAAPLARASATQGGVLWVASAEPTAARPHTVQLVPVAVPAELAPGGDVEYAIVAEEGIRLIGSVSGIVLQSDVGHRPLVVAASLPRTVPAGLQTIARVEYRQGGVLRQEIPVQVQVAQVPGAALRLNQGLVGARPGERFTVALTLTNTGNAPDTIDLRLQAPLGWHGDALPARYPLGPGASVAVEIRVSLPDAVSTGSVRLQIIAASHHQELARADAMVEVLSPGGTLAEGNGPRLTTGVASVLGQSGTSAPVFGLQLEGALTGSMRVYGQAFIPTNADATDVIGLSRVGYFLGNSVLTVATDRWSATAGATGRSFSEETGKNVFGRGGAVTYGDNSWTAAALVAQPAAGTTSASGHLYGASVGANVGAGWLSLTATDLDDGSFSGRTLQSVGLGATTDALRVASISAEVADRKYAGGSGFGWSFAAVHRSPGDYAEFRALNAPGGSAAFARASEEYSAAASHEFNKVLTLGGSAWTSSDHNSAIAKLRSTGWSLSPQVALTSHVSLSANVHANSYDAQSGAGAFGSSEFGALLTGSLRYGTLYGSASVGAGSSTRTTDVPSGPNVANSAAQQILSGMAGWATSHGVFEASALYQRNGANVGLLPQQLVLALRAERVPLLKSGGPLLNAELQQYSWFGSLPSATVVRVGLQAPLPGDFLLTVDVQKNSLLKGISGNGGWVPVVKLERTMGLSVGGLSPGARGVVFEDRNGNGMRDRDERGIPGVVLRQADQTVITNDAGEFTFSLRTDAPVRVDETSLPFGMVVNPLSSTLPAGHGRLAIGVWPTAVVDVRLVPSADETGRLPVVDLRPADVRVVDQSGNVWVARSDSLGRARFDALPPGTYRVELNLTGVREPVHAPATLPVFTVEPGHTVAPIVIPVLPRPVRMFDPTNQRGLRGAQQAQQQQGSSHQ